MNFRGTTVLLAAGLVAAVVGAVFLYQARPASVTVLEPERDVAIKVFGLGTVEARVLTKIGFKVAGTLTDLRSTTATAWRPASAGAASTRASRRRAWPKRAPRCSAPRPRCKVAEAAAKKTAVLVTQRAKVNQRRQSLLARQAVSEEAAEDAQLNEGVARADAAGGPERDRGGEGEARRRDAPNTSSTASFSTSMSCGRRSTARRHARQGAGAR